MPEIQLTDLAAFLNGYFGMEDYLSDNGGIYHPSERPICRIGLALEPWPELPAWVADCQLDALFLHRPWKLDRLPPQTSVPSSESSTPYSRASDSKSASLFSLENTGVVFYHLPFDEYLTPGDSPRLADALLLTGVEALGEKDGRSLGMIGDIAPQPFADVLATIASVFGGYEEALTCGAANVTRLAVVGAMTEALVREAGERGAQVYVTGQFRAPARPIVRALGMGVIAVGHRRGEEWGLRALAGLLRERFAALEVWLHQSSS